MESSELKELAYKFFQEPTRDNFVKLIFDNVGEQDNLDFKEKWIDNKKLTEIILGIANVGIGAIVFGVRETAEGCFEPCGLEELKDKAMIVSQVQKYVPKELKFEILDFDFTGENYSLLKDKLFQILIIKSEDEYLPYILENGFENIDKGTIYYRKGTKTVQADSADVKLMIKKRIKSERIIEKSLYLKEHIEQIKILYEYNSKFYWFNDYINNHSQSAIMMFHEINNKSDSFDKFISEIIEQKKKKIRKILEID